MGNEISFTNIWGLWSNRCWSKHVSVVINNVQSAGVDIMLSIDTNYIDLDRRTSTFSK